MNLKPWIALVALVLFGCQTPSPVAPTPRAAPGGLSIELTSMDLAVGENRIAFVLLREGVPINDANVQLSFYYLGSATPELRATAIAVPRLDHHEHQHAEDQVDVAFFVANASLDRPGRWGLDAHIDFKYGSAGEARTDITLASRPLAPAVGSPAIPFGSKTTRNTPLAELTSMPPADPDLYTLTITEAITSGKPVLITFASPGFCSSRTCGPQLHVVEHLKELYRNSMKFVHVEIYDNPQEMAQNPSAGRLAPAVAAWRLPSEPWTFLVDEKGMIAARFEGFVTLEELEPTVQRLLAAKS